MGRGQRGDHSQRRGKADLCQLRGEMVTSSGAKGERGKKLRTIQNEVFNVGL
jgi:hypothetical protein